MVAMDKKNTVWQK